MKKALSLISNTLFILGLLVAAFILYTRFSGQPAFKLFIVSSGSMEPAIKTGSIVITIPKSSYQIGDIITFYSGSDKKSTTTHRLVSADSQVFKTAGDANNQSDPVLVAQSKVLGQVRYSIPLLGYLAGFAKTPAGFILLVIVPATIIVYEEIKTLSREIFARFKKIHLPNFLSRSPVFIFPVIFAGLIFFTFTGSYFSDTQSSSANSFTAWTPTSIPTPTTPQPTPILLHLVVNELNVKVSPTQQWVELFNPTSDPIDLSGWTFTDDSGTNSLPSYIIPPEAFAILIPSGYTGDPIPSGLAIIIASSNLGGDGLAHQGDRFILRDSSANIIDQISWGNDHSLVPNITGSPGNHKTLARHPNALDTDLDTDWDTQATPSLASPNP